MVNQDSPGTVWAQLVSLPANVEHPDAGAEWQLRVQVQFLFPK